MTAPLPPPLPPDQIPGAGVVPTPGELASVDCGFIDVACQAKEAANSALQQLGDDAARSAAEAAEANATQWIHTPTPIVASQAEDGSVNLDQTVAFIQAHLHWYTWYLAAIVIIIAGAMTAWQRRMEPAHNLLPWFARLIGYGTLGAVVLGMLAAMSDAFSVWIINDSTDNFAGDLVELLGMAGYTKDPLQSPLTIIGIAGIAWFLSGIQTIVLFFRGAVLGVLAGVLPTTAAASYTGMGHSAFQRIRNWAIAYLLYKPTAAIIYANGFISVSDRTGNPLVLAWQSIALMLLALVALPAIIKVINPLADAVSNSTGIGSGLASMAAPTATGIASMSRSRGGGGGGLAAPTATAQPTGTALATGAGKAAGPAGAAFQAGQAAAGVVKSSVGDSPEPTTKPTAKGTPA